MGDVEDMAREEQQPPTHGWGKKPLTTMRPLAGVNSCRHPGRVIVVAVVFVVVVVVVVAVVVVVVVVVVIIAVVV